MNDIWLKQGEPRNIPILNAKPLVDYIPPMLRVVIHESSLERLARKRVIKSSLFIYRASGKLTAKLLMRMRDGRPWPPWGVKWEHWCSGSSLTVSQTPKACPMINIGQVFFPFHHLHSICGALAKHIIKAPIFINGQSSLFMAKPLKYDILFPPPRSDFPIVYQLVFPPGVINTRVVSAEEEAACNNHHHPRRRRRRRAAIFALAKNVPTFFAIWWSLFYARGFLMPGMLLQYLLVT